MIRDFLRKGWRTAVDLAWKGQDWARTHLPPGTRLPVGLLLMAGGFLAFLPVFGLWMLPLGVLIAALDLEPVLRWLQRNRPRRLRPWRCRPWQRSE